MSGRREVCLAVVHAEDAACVGLIHAEFQGVVLGDTIDDAGCAGCSYECAGPSYAVHAGVVPVSFADVMHEHDGTVAVACQLAEHGDDGLHGPVGVLVHEVNADEGVEDDDADVVGFHALDHGLEHGVILQEAIAAFGGEGQLEGVFAVHEELAGYVGGLDAVVLHGGDRAHLHLGYRVFEVHEPDVGLLFDAGAEQLAACSDGECLDGHQACLPDAAGGCEDADVVSDVVEAVDPAAAGDAGCVEAGEGRGPCVWIVRRVGGRDVVGGVEAIVEAVVRDRNSRVTVGDLVLDLVCRRRLWRCRSGGLLLDGCRHHVEIVEAVSGLRRGWQKGLRAQLGPVCAHGCLHVAAVFEEAEEVEGVAPGERVRAERFGAPEAVGCVGRREADPVAAVVTGGEGGRRLQRGSIV